METLRFEFDGHQPPGAGGGPVLAGVVGSGNLEVLIERRAHAGQCRFSVTTSAEGFGEIWRAVLQAFVDRHRLADVDVTINDGGATPAVVSLRLDQAAAAFREARG